MSTKLYAYTFPTYSQKGWIKVGDTQRTVQERVFEQDSTSNPEKPIILKEWNIKDYRDHDVHKILEKKYIRIRKEREWFECSVSDVSSAVNELLYGISRPNRFPLRENQKQFVDKAYESFSNLNYKSFLLAAIMRFGKTFATYKLIEKMNFKTILIMSAKTDVKDAWKEDLNSHIDFDGWIWYDAENSSKNNPLTINKNKKPNIVFLTLQDAKDYDKEKLSLVLNKHYDLVVLDETHFGTETEKTINLLDQIDFEYKLEMSGTAFKKLLSKEYSPENSFVYGLIEEVRDINKGIYSFKDLPQLNVYTVKIDEQVLMDSETDYPLEDDGFKFSTLFAVNSKGEFIHPRATRRFLDILGSSDRPKSFMGISPYSLDILNDKLDHTIWFLPKSIDIVKALAKMIRKHPFFSEYTIFAASGDNEGYKNVDILNQVRIDSEIKKNKKTIVLSAGRFSTGVSMKKWNTVFLMNDSDESPEEYFQSMFRCKTPDKDFNKNSCFAIDFNPDRACVMQYKYAQITSIYENRDTAQILKEFNDVLPIMSCHENSLHSININDIFMAMNRSAENLSTFSSPYIADQTKIDEKISIFLLDINASEFQKIKNIISKNDVRKGKTTKSIKKELEIKEANDILKKIKEKIITIMGCVPTYIYTSNSNIDGVKSFMSHIEINHDKFEKYTGSSVEMFKYMYSLGVINNIAFEKAIEEYNLVSNSFGDCI